MASTKSVKEKAAAAKERAVKAKERAKAAEARVKAAAPTKQLGGFVDFIRTQGVVGLAVGLAIGTAAGATVKVIVEQLINPLVGLLTRGVDLSNLRWVLIDANPVKAQPEVAIGYGAILSSTIVLVATALVIYLIVHGAKLDRLDKKKDA
jgi:large conductance mechanosensitive channel